MSAFFFSLLSFFLGGGGGSRFPRLPHSWLHNADMTFFHIHTNLVIVSFRLSPFCHRYTQWDRNGVRSEWGERRNKKKTNCSKWRSANKSVASFFFSLALKKKVEAKPRKHTHTREKQKTKTR